MEENKKSVFVSVCWVPMVTSFKGQSYFRTAYTRLLEEELRLAKGINLLSTKIELLVSESSIRVVFMSKGDSRIHTVYEIPVGPERAAHIKRLNTYNYKGGA